MNRVRVIGEILVFSRQNNEVYRASNWWAILTDSPPSIHAVSRYSFSS